MAPGATTQPHVAAHNSITDPDHPDASDAETEPLPYDDAHEDGQHSDIVMDPSELAHHADAASADLDAPGEEIDEPMHPDAHSHPLDHAHSDSHHPSHRGAGQDAHDDDDDEEEDDVDANDLSASQATAAHDPNSNMSSPQKTGGFTGDEFSDDSELTDEEEDQNDDDDASSLSDDDLGGSDDDDDDDDADDDNDQDDRDSKTHEDEAAEALAALTGGADAAADDASAATAAGLDALAALATAGVNGDATHATHAEDDDEDDVDDDEASDADADADDGEAAAEAATSLDDIAKHGRLHQLRQQADADDLSSDITPEPEEDAEAHAHAGADDASDHEDAGSPRTTDLDLIASMKKRAAATGGATSLLEPEQLVDSLPDSAATSRAPSPLADEDDDADKPKPTEHAEADADVKASETEQAEAVDTAIGTPAPDAAEPEEDVSTDEAAIRRQEAMEALTKIEIGFAMLRDRLYVERLQEISKEGEMIQDGTHPELLHLNKAIEMRRQRRTQLVELWFEEQEQQYERVANAEEFAAWSIWRSSCASLRRDMMDEFSRKRRRLDREKRTLDAPRPARRHQIFETELVRNPDRLHIPLAHASVNDADDRAHPNETQADRQRSAKRKAIARDIERGDEFVAYPDLKGLADVDVMMDIEQMGIRPAGVPPGMYDPFYGGPVGLEFPNPDVYAMYGPEAAAAAAAAAAAQAQMNGFPYGMPPGARGIPAPHPGMMMGPGTPHRHGMHPLPPPPGHMHPGMEMGMMGFDPYAAAEMERAARMHHREQAARMGIDPHDPHHRSSPFPPDMYHPYPPQYGMPPGPPGPGPAMGGPPRGAGGNMPASPTPPHRGSGRKDRASVDDGVHVSGRGRGAAKTSGRSKQSRASQTPAGAGGARDGPATGLPPAASPSHAKPAGGAKTSLPPPPSMTAGAGAADERDLKMHSNGTAAPPRLAGSDPRAAVAGGGPNKTNASAGSGGGAKVQPERPPAATPVAVAASKGVANTRLYPPSQVVAPASNKS